MAADPPPFTPIPFVMEEHFEELQRWFQARNEDLAREGLPQSGFVIPGKAAGFLYRTDSSLALIENLVASPELRPEERSAAVDAIVLAVSDEARRLGFKMLLGYTQLDAVVKRAVRLGFTYVAGGYHTIILPL